MKKCILLLLGGICCLLQGHAQQFQLSTYDIDKRLSRGLIKAVITDDIGFLWSATDEGVIRFDGKETVFFRDVIPGGFAKAFCKRVNGDMLVLHDFGLTQIISQPDTTYFKTLLSGYLQDLDTSLYYPKAVFEDHKGTLWIGENQAVVRYDGESFQKFRFSSQDFADNFLRSFSFAEDSQNRLWAISYNGNLYYYQPEDRQFIPVALSIDIQEVGSMHYRGEGKLWVGAKNGFFEITVTNNGQIVSSRIIGDIDNVSTSILINPEEFYVGTFDQGLFQADLLGSGVTFKPLSVLPFPNIISLHFDPQNGLWVSGSESIGLLHPIFFKTLELEQEERTISDFTFLSDSLLLVSNEHQLYQFSLQLDNWILADSLIIPASLSPRSLLVDGDRLWMGDFTGEVFYYDLSQDGLYSVDTILAGSFITQIVKDSHQNIWIAGNRRHGLIRISPDEQIRFYSQPEVQYNQVVCESPTGVIFCANSDPDYYLSMYDPSQDTFIDISENLNFTLSNNFAVEDLAFDEDGSLLIATSDGLLRYQLNPISQTASRAQRIDLGVVPIDESIKSVVQSDGVIWIATSQGLIMFQNDQSLLYDRSSGLPSRNLTARGLQVDNEGEVWIATAQGLAYLSSSNSSQSVTPTPIFQNLTFNGERAVSDSDTPVFPYDTYLNATFISLSYPADQLQYQTQIMGLDSTWVNQGTDNRIFVPRFPEGEYTLQVRAQQHGGFRWSDPLSYTFAIARPWYTKGWAWALYALLIVGVVIIFNKLYHWHLLRKNRQLETIVQKRTEEVRQQSDQIIEQNERYRKLKEQQLEQEIEYRNKQLTSYTLNLVQKNQVLKDLRAKIVDVRRQSRRDVSIEMKRLLSLIDQSFRSDRGWEEFKLYFEEVHAGFFEELKTNHPELTPQDLRLCAMIRLNLTITESASILGISPESMKTSRFRLRKKMELPSINRLEEYIMQV